MHPRARRSLLAPLLAGAALTLAALTLAACGYSPAELGITGPSPGQSLTPPPPTAAELNPDASAVLPGVQTGNDPYAPSVLTQPSANGKFYGTD